MKALIMPNLDKPNCLQCTTDVCNKLNECKITPLMDDSLKSYFDHCNVEFGEFFAQLSICDIVIAIGGDGTIIHSAKHAVELDKKILGINVGRLGFIAGLEPDELDKLSLLKTGEYTIEKRLMLEVLHNTNRYIALNDVVVSNGELSKIIDIDLFCDDKKLNSIRADGMIVSTPTGSTAYALSAGGPIVESGIKTISVTPICPHSLMGRTLIFSENRKIKIKPSETNNHPIYVTIDGDYGAKLENDDEVLIKKSEKSARFIKLNDKSFFEVLNQKLR